jgi:amino acid transporter
MHKSLKYMVLGAPLHNEQSAHKKLNKIRALAAFSPDGLSSIGYANQEIYLGLLVAGSVGLSQSLPVALAITALLAVVGLSYFQTIHAYPSGGGSYTVARENLGTLPGLIAGAALMIGYLLTAAVSLTAGVDAIASAFPVLWGYRIVLALLLLLAMTLLNLRGMSETGTVMAVPVYLFLIAYLPMLAYGGVVLLIDGPRSLQAFAPHATQPLTFPLMLYAFSSGCTALTGIEAISNGVPAFKPPETRNAGRTLFAMAILMGVLFVGSVGLTQALAVVAGPQETILSALAHRVLGNGLAYLVIQGSTMLILAVAANTSFAGFPRLVSLLAADSFLPHQLTRMGHRLVYSNGILLLASATAILIIGFGGDTHSLIPLFAVGVFLAYTLSQTGMVAHWWRKHAKRWRAKAAMNGAGALASGITLVVIGFNKFVQGAWITILLVPTLLIAFLWIRAHYRDISLQLSMHGLSPSELKPPTSLHANGSTSGPFPTVPGVVVPIFSVDRGIVDAINYARSISNDVTAIYVEVEHGAGHRIQEEWMRYWPDLPLVVLPSPFRTVVEPFLDFLDEVDREHRNGRLTTVILPECVPPNWWRRLLHDRNVDLIRNALLDRQRRLRLDRVVIDVPYYLR